MSGGKGFFVKNILIIGDENGRNGEFRSQINQNIPGCENLERTVIFNEGDSDSNRSNRIVEQIKLLGEYAKNNRKPTQITRVVTDEFSFYPKNTPLTIDEYKKIINQTSEALKDLPPNIVLVISSMPVIWPDGTLRNAVLHIQSPNSKDSEPIIHHFSKEGYASIDPTYSKDNTVENSYTFQPDDYSSPQYSPDVILSDTKAQCYDKNQYKSAIVVQPVGLPPIIDAIDICLDHLNGVALQNAAILVNNIEDPPFHISHIITSNSVPLSEKYLSSSSVHSDPFFKKVEGVYEKKKDLIQNMKFGSQSFSYIYNAKRAEILHSKLFNLSIKNTKKTMMNLLDNNDNTLLHQALFKDKNNNPHCTHRKKRLKKILHYVKENSITLSGSKYI